MSKVVATIDGNEAVARVAYKTNEVIAIRSYWSKRHRGAMRKE